MSQHESPLVPIHKRGAQPDAEAAAVWVDRSSLTPWADNPRDNDEAVAKVAASIRRFGFGSPIIARTADSMVIAGHTRLKAAESLGIDRVPVRFLDLDPTDSRLLALVDNKAGEIADWNDDGLRAVLEALAAEDADLDALLEGGFTEDDLTGLWGDEGGGDADDDAPEIDTREPAVSQPGEVYVLGRHRLICGDATDPDAWDALLRGETLDLVWTDPPYGVEYEDAEGRTIENDDLEEGALDRMLREAFALLTAHARPGAGWYVCSPQGPLTAIFGNALKDLGVWRQTLIWVKDRFVLGRSDHHYQHEPIYYGWTPGGAHTFTDDRTQTSVLNYPRPSRSKYHPTQKPVAMVQAQIRNSTHGGQIVCDPFGGSGTTLIAADAEGRSARVMELDPHYCDGIRRRWTKHARARNIDPGPHALEPLDREDQDG